MPASEIAGKIIVESLVVAIGVSVGTAQLGGGDSDSNEDTGMDGTDGASEAAGQNTIAKDSAGFVGQLVLAFCGAILIAANVAPTEEIIVLAVEIEPWRLLGLALFSIILSTLILYFSDFRSTQRLMPDQGFFAVFWGATVTYAVALSTSAVLLWFFGSFEGFAPSTCLAETIILGVAAVLGSSAGRLLLQANSQE